MNMHKNFLFARDHCFPSAASTLVKGFFVDSSLADEVADFYTKTFLTILPDALKHRHRAAHAFALAIDALLANKVLRSDGDRVREIANSLISTLWSYQSQHTESVDLPIIDHAMHGLLRLLAEVISILKSFKKPLALPGLSTQILARLLFPPYKEASSKPLIDPSTRTVAYRLVQATCESEADFTSLLDATLAPMLDTNGNPQDNFPGVAQWLRPAPKCSGLPNLGMTCYMNSLLQQLFANVRFRKFIFEVPVVDSNKQALLKEVQRLFAQMQDNYCSSPNTAAVAQVLNVQTESQEDVHGCE